MGDLFGDVRQNGIVGWCIGRIAAAITLVVFALQLAGVGQPRGGRSIVGGRGQWFIDSAGIGALLQGTTELKGEGPIPIVASRQVARFFEITGLGALPGD